MGHRAYFDVSRSKRRRAWTCDLRPAPRDADWAPGPYDSRVDIPPPRTRRLIILGILALAAGLFAAAVIVSSGNSDSLDLPVAIQSVSPGAGDNVLSQSDIVVDLAVGYTAELEVNGLLIPEADLFRVDGLNQVTFRPGAGTLLPDQNCVQVRYWLIASGPADASLYTWCFFSS